jgi:hypothetical protein
VVRKTKRTNEDEKAENFRFFPTTWSTPKLETDEERQATCS